MGSLSPFRGLHVAAVAVAVAVVVCFGGCVLASAGTFPHFSLCTLDVVQPAPVHTPGQVNDENRRPPRRRSGNAMATESIATSSRLCFACLCWGLGTKVVLQ